MYEVELTRLRMIAANGDLCAQFEEGNEETRKQASDRFAGALAAYRVHWLKGKKAGTSPRH